MNATATTTIIYHVRYHLKELNEWWDWLSKDSPEEAVESFLAHKPRVEASDLIRLITTTCIETEQEINHNGS